MNNRLIYMLMIFGLSSCGLLQNFRPKIYYDPKTYHSYPNSAQAFKYEVDYSDSTLQKIKENGKVKYLIIVSRQGQVERLDLIKSTFSKTNEEIIYKKTKELKFIPFVSEDFGISTFEVKINKSERKHFVLGYGYLEKPLRPLTLKERQKFLIAHKDI